MTAPLRKLSFLVVDDNANMVQIVKTILKNFGVVNIYEARDVAEAFDFCRQYTIDIVLLDYHLGFMDGVEFIRMIRNATDSRDRFLPIIMVTGHTEEHRVHAARDAGVTEFCCKPVTAFEIYRKIVEVVEHPRAYVRAPHYFGPDRRRHHNRDYNGPERRTVEAEPVDGAKRRAKAG